MTQIRIDGITGVTYPVDLYVADIYGNNRYFLATISSGPVPPELAYTTLPAIFLTVVCINHNQHDRWRCVKYCR